MNVLFVDDSHERFYRISVALMYTSAALDHAMTMDKALEFLATYQYDYIFLDYDLGENAGSGRGVAEYIARNIEKFIGCTIVIHSANPAGAQHMLNDIQNAMERYEQQHTVFNPIKLYYAPLLHADKCFLKTIGLL